MDYIPIFYIIYVLYNYFISNLHYICCEPKKLNKPYNTIRHEE
jgi:hypothetical protein